MPVVRLPSKALKGLSFSVPELTLIRSWSDANGLRMVVRLDHRSEAEDYEEVLALHVGERPLYSWMMWRGQRMVFIQPLIGRSRRFGSIADAFEDIAEQHSFVVSDIIAESWPA